MKRVVEFEINTCADCPNFVVCLALNMKAQGGGLEVTNGFFKDCPKPWHEKGYDRIKDLEEEVAGLKAQSQKGGWIPVTDSVKPEMYKRILTTSVDKASGQPFLSHEMYIGNFYESDWCKTTAWQYAPELYRTKEEEAEHKRKLSMLARFTRIE